MAVINQLNINLGTEANQNFVLHDINDKRITTTAITTCSHILASNSAGLTSIAPITAANLASVLGALTAKGNIAANTDFNNLVDNGIYGFNKDASSGCSNYPAGYGLLVVFDNKANAGGGNPKTQMFFTHQGVVFVRTRWSGTWSSWKEFTIAEDNMPVRKVTITNATPTLDGGSYYIDDVINASDGYPVHFHCSNRNGYIFSFVPNVGFSKWRIKIGNSSVTGVFSGTVYYTIN